MAVNYETGVVTGVPITEPSDLQKLLGISTNDYADILLASTINPYSKKKPVENPNVYHKLSDAQFSEVDWGYRIPIVGIKQDTFREYVRNGTVPSGWENPNTPKGAVSMGFGWYYIRPYTIFRPWDLIGYNHKAERKLFGDVLAPTQAINQNTQSMYIQFNRGTFALNDFDTYKNMHFGVIIMMDGNNTVWFKSIVDAEADANYPTISFSRTEMNKMFVGGYGTYKVWAVATPDNVQNIDSSASYYNSQFTSIHPLPGEPASFKYEYQGVASVNIAFHITNLIIEYQDITFDLYASNTGDAAGSVGKANIKYDVNALDNEGNEYNKGLANLDSSVGNVSIPVGGTRVKIGSYSVPYAAYRQLFPPWFATLKIYYPNTAGTSVLYTSMGDTYEG